jgi:KUP system potassium uptake protein
MLLTSQNDQRGCLARLTIAALGVVYGDIGTSPLYSLRICFSETGAVPVTQPNIFGILSLILWSLLILISLKYLTFVLRADNHGEGGILALMTLVRSALSGRFRIRIVVTLGLFGAALLYGDGLITPVISVLSAVEGLTAVTPLFEPYVVPISIVILMLLFLFQRRGTGALGAVFGPVMIVWFITIGILGLISILETPTILAALDPRHAVFFFVHNGWRGILPLGAVFLALTGGEALYADMGHFGKHPIRIGWYGLVLPALVLNYLGQGAHLLRYPAEIDNLFYHLAPSWALLPLVGLATAATIIASQAVISGAFSLTRQAVQLGYSPRLAVQHTSLQTIGQVYVPGINWALMAGAILLTLAFQHSDNLAGAYGVAVSTTMLITTLMLYMVMQARWRWSPSAALAVIMPFLVLDLAFFSSNALKILHGGWISLLVAAVAYLFMTTWKEGREVLRKKLVGQNVSEEHFLQDLDRNKPLRVPGLAIFLAGHAGGIPRTLLHNFKHNRIIHERVILLTVHTEEVPRVDEKERIETRILGQGFYRIILRFGFGEHPDLPHVLKKVNLEGIDFHPMNTTFFLGRETMIVSSKGTMPVWRKLLFAAMSRNALDASKFFRLPPNRVVEIGIQVEL